MNHHRLMNRIKQFFFSFVISLVLLTGLNLFAPALAIPASEDLTDHSTLIDQGGRSIVGRGENQGIDQRSSSGSQLKNIAETVKEKLNLDEPLYPGTKEFIDDVKSDVGETVEPLTGRSGNNGKAS